MFATLTMKNLYFDHGYNHGYNGFSVFLAKFKINNLDLGNLNFRHGHGRNLAI